MWTKFGSRPHLDIALKGIWRIKDEDEEDNS